MAQFNLDFTPLSAHSEIVDSKGVATSIAISFSGTSTTASLIESLQPIAQLRDGFTYSSSAGSPACVRCTPGCSACSDIYTCTTCDSGTPKGGLCLDAALSPNSGTANSTSFTVDITDFA